MAYSPVKAWPGPVINLKSVDTVSTWLLALFLLCRWCLLVWSERFFNPSLLLDAEDGVQFPSGGLVQAVQ
jgi:hypothetical protein